MFGKSVNQTTGSNVCPESPGDICKAGTPSALPGGFQAPAFIAVDNSTGPSAGDVYVGDVGTNLVTKFTSGGQLETGWGASGQKDGLTRKTSPASGHYSVSRLGARTATLCRRPPLRQ